MKYLLTLTIVLFFSACTTKTPHIEEYRIAPNFKIKDLKQGQCSKKTIKLAPTFSSSLYRTLEMDYAQGAYELDNFTESQWAVSVNRAINTQVLTMLNASKLFYSVQLPESRSSDDYILETNIEDFMQYFDEKVKNSLVKVKINMTLIDAKSSKVIANKSFTITMPVKELNAASGVATLNQALAKVLETSSLWLEEVCQ